jgi:hypothetical protein
MIDDPSRLFGLSLCDAFRMFILEDPEIIRLGKLVLKREPQHADLFRQGVFPRLGISYQWPLDLTASELASEMTWPFLTFSNDRPVKPSQAVELAAKAIVDKLQSLRRLLETGQVEACGTFDASGAFGPIHRQQWARAGLLIDIRSSDLLEHIDNRNVVRRSGVILEAPTSAKPIVSRTGERKLRKAATTGSHVKPTGYYVLRSASIRKPSSPQPRRRLSAQQASIAKAIAALWPQGVPDALPVKTRDEKINAWQKAEGIALASSKTIQRFFSRLTNS